MKKRFTEEQIVGILREAESGEKSITQIGRQHGISDPTFYAWRRKFNSMSEPEINSPWQNGLNERFNGSYRDECANLETFHNRDHARALSQVYKRHYNQERPHSSLAYQTPAEFAAGWRIRKEEKDVADLSHYAPPADKAKGNGPTAINGRPISRMVVHAGAQVASQQSLILRDSLSATHIWPLLIL